MNKTTLGVLRKAVKAINSTNTVSSTLGGEGFKIKTKYNYEAVKQLMSDLGLRVILHDAEGPRWDATHVFTVA